MATDTGSTNEKDTVFKNWAADTNYGNENFISAYWVDPNVMRSVISFTLSAGSGTISLVELYLKVKTNVGSQDVQVHQLTNHTDWGELTATWNKYDGANAWTGGGAEGDYGAAIDTVTTPAATNWQSWVIQGAGGSGVPLVGLDWGDPLHLFLRFETEGGTDRNSAWHSKEAAAGADKPYIKITYSVPGKGAQYIQMNPLGVTMFGGKTN